MTRRPVGVVLSAIVLGIAAAMLCLMGGISALGAVLLQTTPVTVSAPGVTPPSQGFMLVIMAVTVCFYLALAAWAIVTLVGLVRMRNWARISTMIIGGGLAAMGLLCALVAAAMPSMMKSMQIPSTADPVILRDVFLFMAMVWLAIAAIGMWWLVYFALRRTREAFAQNAAQATAQRGFPTSGMVYAAHSSTAPMTDFTVAQPIVYQQPVTPAEFYVQPSAPQSVAPARPVTITIIAILMLFGAVITLLISLLPFPAFFFGVVLAGWTGRTVYLVLACISGTAGIGLLRRQKPAWILSLALYGVGLLNILSLALPGVRARLLEYQQMLAHTAGMPSPVLSQKIANFFLLYSMVFDMFLIAFLMVLLWRARWAFEPSRTPDDTQAAA